ncbi:helix-turn-helix domain-containing protein [Bacteroides acidifaciens]|uniref:ATP-dependent DNA helicase UvrD2 n=1 Tax=Bacteroides acidifaciens TaxID=85831 RepID=A0A7J0A8D0_9BACE|nr:helix-turn-helix domain-containing protein [Bacteroides acidifaciens]GFH88426.1 ATP-dependent DNA helicase UvrD2 [Bacteroides acidifaciens]
MENNPELQLAWQFIENTGTHLFLTGKAGTGKTTFLRRLREQSPKRMVVLAPTGIAAINAGGVTIHSFFQLSFAPFVPDTTLNSAQIHYRINKEKRNIIRSMDLLVIDEISMVRADLLDAVDATLRRYRDREKPFGGVQLLMIGDLQQLAPVVKDSEWEMLRHYYETPYFFASRALRETTYMTIELEKVYRQSDTFFLSLLNKIRENKADDEVLNELNKRYQRDFQPPKEEGYIRLTTHNNQAQRINDRELASLPGKAYSFRAEVKDDFPEYSYPADEVLTIKEGAQIMFLKNDVSSEKRYYNGMIGEVVTVNETGMFVRGKDSEHEFQLLQEEWGNYKYVLNEETKEITEEIAGVFRQYPIRLAWAITIHKSQGLTFERAIIDARNSFAHGQTYVALSRCKTLDGMVLESPLRREAIISDSVVDNFTKAVERNKPGNKQLNDMQKAYFFDLLSDLFNFYSIEQAYKRLLRMMDENLYRLFPKQLAEYKALEPHMKERIVEVARRFRNQYTRLINESEDYAGNQELQERIRSGAGYFRKELEPVRALFDKTNMPLDNRELRKQLNERLQTLDDALCIKESLLDTVCTSTFTVSDYLKQKAKVMLSLEEDSSTSASSSRVPGEKRERKERAASSRSGKVKVDVPTDILHPELYRALAEWRTEKTREANVPAYVIMQQKALMGIVNLLPDTPAALEAIPYFGAKGVEKYGLEILGIVRKYMKENQVERPEVKEIFISAKEHKKDKKKEEKKELKKDTKIVSYEMFCQGMSIEEIAKARDLVTGTIAGHLEQYVRSGKIKVEQVVKAENLAKIRKYLEEHEYMGMFAIKAALGDDVSYADIKFALVASGLVRPS